MNLGFSGPIEERRVDVANARVDNEIVCDDLHLGKEFNEPRGIGGGISWYLIVRFSPEMLFDVSPKRFEARDLSGTKPHLSATLNFSSYFLIFFVSPLPLSRIYFYSTTTCSNSNMGKFKKEASRKQRDGKVGDGMANVKVKGENFYRSAKKAKQLKILTGGTAQHNAAGKVTKAAAFQTREVPQARIEVNCQNLSFKDRTDRGYSLIENGLRTPESLDKMHWPLFDRQWKNERRIPTAFCLNRTNFQ